MSSLALLPSHAVAVSHGAPMTTSLVVAEVFEKLHKDVLRSIENIKADCPADFTERNFALSDYTDSTGRKLPMVEMTKDGFTFLAMGYTGPKAAQFKVAYINCFNEMESALRQTPSGLSPDEYSELLDRKGYSIVPKAQSAPSNINSVARWTAVYTGNRWILNEIPHDAAILPHRDWPSVIRTTDFPRDMLPEVLTAVSERMKGLPPQPAQVRRARNFAPTVRESVLAHIRKARSKGLTTRELEKKCADFNKLEICAKDGMLAALHSSGLVELQTSSGPSGRGRKRVAWVAVKDD